jgi:Rod binding domain-containing protein
MFSGGQSEETYRGLLIDEYGKEIARAGGIGIADSIARQMILMQEQQP